MQCEYPEVVINDDQWQRGKAKDGAILSRVAFICNFAFEFQAFFGILLPFRHLRRRHLSSAGPCQSVIRTFRHLSRLPFTGFSPKTPRSQMAATIATLTNCTAGQPASV